MTSPREEDFFIGWARPPRSLRGFLFRIFLVTVASFGVTSVLIGATKPDPGVGSFQFGWGPQTVVGVLTADPYPTIQVIEGSERVPEGHTLMLAGQGKRGAQGRAEALDGALVEASGVLIKRGALDMMQLRGGRNGLKAAEAAPEPEPEPEADTPLGRWRLSGEICDGKCLAGAMRPGRGLAHKACANLCLIGGAPPVFVLAAPVEGSEYLLLGDPEGAPLGEALYDLVARLVTLEGELVRRGDLLIFKTDLATAEFPG